MLDRRHVFYKQSPIVGLAFLLVVAAPMRGGGRATHAATSTIRYVDGDAPAGGDGSSWDSAYKYLQDALAAAASSGGAIEEIRVAQGIYKPDQGANQTARDRAATFQLLNGVEVRGGYAGLQAVLNGLDPNARDIRALETILSGDLAGNDRPNFVNYSENSYHVLNGGGTNATAVLDGFIITGGNATVSKEFNKGGGLYIINGSPTLKECTFRWNMANNAGAIYAYKSTAMTLSGCIFQLNMAKEGNSEYGRGGAITFSGDGSNVTLLDCIFEQNVGVRSPTEGGSGGGICCSFEGKLTINNCTFIENQGGFGGGIYCYGPNGTISNCTFRKNTGSLGGGGIMLWKGDWIISQCVFAENTVGHDGGGVLIYYISPWLVDCDFIENRADGGAGVFNYEGSPVIDGCRFINNSGSLNVTDSGGAGVYNEGNGEPIIINCSFFGNEANYGAATCNIQDTNSTFINCLFSGNHAGVASGAAWVDHSQVDFVNCTLGGNIAEELGGGMRGVNYAVLNLANSILWNNRDRHGINESAQIDLEPTAQVDVHFCCIHGWTGQLDGPRNIGDNPLFIDAKGSDGIAGTEDDNLRLLAGSPCIDAGDNDSLPYDTIDHDNNGLLDDPIPWDLDGGPRFINDPDTDDSGNGIPPIVDMGAYEYLLDCNRNFIMDACDVGCGQPGGPCDVPGCGQSEDCNQSGIPDDCELDTDGDGIIDDCDDDDDNDGLNDQNDNCPLIANSDQADGDIDGVGDLCDDCPDTIAGMTVDEAGCPIWPPGDFDHDGDVDQEDFGHQQVCISGPKTIQLDPNCRDADVDEDDDVDQGDLAIFQRCMQGPNIIVPANCAGN